MASGSESQPRNERGGPVQEKTPPPAASRSQANWPEPPAATEHTQAVPSNLSARPPPPPPPRCPIQLQAPASARVRAYPPLCQGRAVLNVGVGFGGKKGHHAPDYLAFRLLELAKVSKGSSPHFLKSHLKIKGNPQNTNKNKYYQKKLKGE